MLEREVAKGVLRVEDAYTNWYLIEEGDRLSVVDCGIPASWDSLHAALRELDRHPTDIEAILLTHAHADHLGFAERARSELRIPVLIHKLEVPLARDPVRYDHERNRLRYLLDPRALPVGLAMVRGGILKTRPLREMETFTEGTLPVPGSPQVVFCPGHTYGHCAFYLPDRDALIAGDAVVTRDPYSGRTGPRIMPGAATADSALNLRSLDAVAATSASALLPGHGVPWTGGAAEAVRLARIAGPS